MGWRLGWVLREFAAVVDTYEDGAQRLARQKKLLLVQVGMLRSAEKSLRKLLAQPVPAELESSIRRTRKLLKLEISKRTAEIEDRLWNFELMLWRPALRKLTAMADREFDLESKFQIRIAFLLLTYLHAAAPQPARKLRFANISRLVMLFYSAAQLAEQESNSFNLRCQRTGKLLSRKIIDQNLTRAGLNKTDFRLSSLTRTRGLASH